MPLTKANFIARWRKTRDFQERGVGFTFKPDSGADNTGTAAVSQATDETVLALAGLLPDYRLTIEAECDNFTTAPYKSREIVLTEGPHAGRYQILRAPKDELGALYRIDLGAIL